MNYFNRCSHENKTRSSRLRTLPKLPGNQRCRAGRLRGAHGAQSCQSQATFIHAANPRPTAAIAAKAASLPPSPRAGQRAGGRGSRASMLDRNAGDEATPAGPLAGCPHPRCQDESLPPPSPPSRIPADLSRAGPRAGGRGSQQSSSIGVQATCDFSHSTAFINTNALYPSGPDAHCLPLHNSLVFSGPHDRLEAEISKKQRTIFEKMEI